MPFPTLSRLQGEEGKEGGDWKLDREEYREQ